MEVEGYERKSKYNTTIKYDPYNYGISKLPYDRDRTLELIHRLIKLTKGTLLQLKDNLVMMAQNEVNDYYLYKMIVQCETWRQELDDREFDLNSVFNGPYTI